MKARTLILPLLLVGCVQTVRFPPDLWPDDEWSESGRLVLESIDVTCTPALRDVWSGQLTTSGFPIEVQLELRDGEYGEVHDLYMAEDAVQGVTWETGPIEGGIPEAELDDSQSAFDCSQTDELTYVVLLLDDALQPVDCAWWGVRPPDDHFVFTEQIGASGGCTPLD